MSQYTYAPLADSQIRFLRIQRHAATLEPVCDLEQVVVPFGDGYTALSYTWGDLTPTRGVLIEGRNHNVSLTFSIFFNPTSSRIPGTHHPIGIFGLIKYVSISSIMMSGASK
ncbi:hypothetical protein IG631_08056 [Alternaria alternata]|nr:hypothetical protein IG631_08056 [Alternaria alternata]